MKKIVLSVVFAGLAALGAMSYSAGRVAAADEWPLDHPFGRDCEPGCYTVCGPLCFCCDQNICGQGC